jgi:CheY-like chemotaxis protein
MIRRSPPILDRDVPPGTRVLCVDDECAVGDVIAQILGNHFECEVDAVCNAEEALRTLENRSFDVIIVDFLMPNMDGGELFTRIARRHPELLPRLMFMTGDTLSDSTLDFIGATGQLLLEKPFGIAELTRAVGQVLRNAKNGRARPRPNRRPGATPR